MRMTTDDRGADDRDAALPGDPENTSKLPSVKEVRAHLLDMSEQGLLHVGFNGSDLIFWPTALGKAVLGMIDSTDPDETDTPKRLTDGS